MSEVRTDSGFVEAAVLVRTGHLAREPHDYPAVVVAALLAHAKEALEFEAARAVSDAADDPDPGPIHTGDDIADGWEAALARGETPDLDAR